MNNTKIYFLFLLVSCMFCQLTVEGQVVIRPNAVNPFFTFNQGTDVQLINASNQSFEGVLQVRLDDNSSNSIFQIQSLPFTIQAGEITGSDKIPWENGIEYSDNAFARLLMQNGTIPNGQFVYCYRFVEVQTGMSVGNYCQENSLANFQLPQLVFPFNNQTIKTLYPLLTWRAPLPFVGSQINYSLVLVEQLEGQTSIEALNTNLPLIEQYRIRTESIAYPISGIPLKKGNSYTWQVTAYWDNQEMGKTQIWKFTVGENELEEIEAHTESYRGVKDGFDGSYFVFSGDLYFSYDNRYADDELSFIIKEQDDKNKQSIDVPKVELKRGINHIRLETKGMRLKKNRKYVMTITDSKKKEHYLVFKMIRK